MHVYFYTFRTAERKLTDSVIAMGVPKNITLEGDDECVVRDLLETNDIHTVPCAVVTLQPKIKIRGQVIFSKESKRVKKRNTFTVAFTDPLYPDKHCYGRVKRFLTCPADTPNCLHVAVIEPLQVEHCRDLHNLTTHQKFNVSDRFCAMFLFWVMALQKPLLFL